MEEETKNTDPKVESSIPNTPSVETDGVIHNIKKKFLVRPLRTYEDDVSDFVRKEKVSTSTIVLAEEERRRERSKIIKIQDDKKNITTGLKVSVILVILGVLVIAGIIFINPADILNTFHPSDSADDLDPVLINKTTDVIFASDGKLSSEIKDSVAVNIENPPVLEKGEIAEFKITKKREVDIDGEIIFGNPEKISTAAFIEIMELDMPEGIIRSFNSDYLFGVINTGNNTSSFILFKTFEFNRIFSGMFDWESTMYRSVNDIFFKTLGTDDFLFNDGTSVGSSSSVNNFDPSNLVDIVIFNRDARAIININGEILFYYTFVDNEYLLLASDKLVVEEIAKKLNLQRLIR